MGRIGIVLDDELERQVREKVKELYGTSRGGIQIFFTNLIKDYLKENP